MVDDAKMEFIEAVQDLATAAANLSKLWSLSDVELDNWVNQWYPVDTLPDFSEVEAALFGWACDIERS